MDDQKTNAQNLVNEAKSVANAGNLLGSMELFKKAYALFPSEKIKNRMTKLQEFMNSQEESEDEDEDLVDIGNKFFIHKSIANNLYQYQKDGVLWFWKLYKRNAGGILGDDMGLGKTIQVIAFLAGMFDAELIKTVIIVAPLAVLVNWEKEFQKWAPGVRVKSFHGPKKKARETNLKKVQKSRGVLLTTYGMVLSNADSLSVDYNDDTFVWDYIILDEGHTIRNPTKTSANVRKVPARFHYICTGTAIQNNLMEMWALFDFTQEGQLLGRKKTFETEFQKPIVRAREKDANSYCQQVGNQISEKLREIIAPYFLRRTKAGIFSIKSKQTDVNGNDIQSKVDHKSGRCTPQLTAVKRDLIIWVYLNPLQLKLYQGIVQSQRVKETLMTTRSPLAELNIMKKLCDHPRLQSTLSKFLSSAESREARLDCNIEEEDNGETEDLLIEEAAHAPPVESLIEDSGKMVFLVCLMANLKKDGHRTLIFSQSRKMLDIIQKVLMSLEHKLLRIDGTINNPQDREKIICKFQTDHSYNVLLMTTQIGSVGLNLTCADRLVIFDPSWNPGTDSQAVDRIYRLGQKKNVVIYRLITCGSIEEKIYRKQIFKNAIMKQTTGSSDNPYRYFTNQDLRELFVLDDPRNSITHMQLQEMHPVQSTDASFLSHLDFLKDEESVFGVSHHNLLFSEEAINDELTGFEDQVVAQVQLAAQRVKEVVNDEAISPKTKTKSTAPVDEKKGKDFVLPANSFLLEKDDDNSNRISILEQKDDSDSSSISVSEQSHYKEENHSSSSIPTAEPSCDKGDIHSSNSISILEHSPDKVEFYNSNIQHEGPTSTLSHSIGVPKETSGNINSSNEELYVSCMEDTEDRMQMAKINSTFAGIKINDQKSNHRKSLKPASFQNASVDVVLDSADDTDSDAEAKENCSGNLLSHVDDTDLEESSDTQRLDYSKNKIVENSDIILDSFANPPEYQAKVTPNLIRNLGTSYRTPPFSPLVKKNFMNESLVDRRNNRDASTPLDGSYFSSKQKDNLAKNLHKTPGFKLDLYEDEKSEGVTAGYSCKSKTDENHAIIDDNKKIEIPNESYLYEDEKSEGGTAGDSSNNKTDENHAIIDDNKKIEIPNKSFIEVLDVGCSPIPMLSNYDQNLISVIYKDEKKCSANYEPSDEKYIDSKSFVELLDVGCSPISISLNNDCQQLEYKEEESLETEEMMTDTVPILHNSSNLQSSTIEVLTDTVPILHNSSNLQSSTIEVFTDTVPIHNDLCKGVIGKSSKKNPVQANPTHNSPYKVLLSDNSEECHFDYRRLEKVREISLQKQKSDVANGKNCERSNSRTDSNSNVTVHDSSYSEMSDIFGCEKQSKHVSDIKLTNIANSPSKHVQMSPCKLTEHMEKNKKLKQPNELITLITNHMNDDDIDDHVMIRIAELIKLRSLR